MAIKALNRICAVSCIENSPISTGLGAPATTIGSCVGTLLTSFFLVLWFELNTILLVGIGISYAIAATTLIVRRS